MKIDRLILKELAGPWTFGVGLFSSLLMAGTYLGIVTNYIADGVPASLVVQFLMLLMPAVLVKTFSMSVLLASLLGFGRLSSDSEIVALRASGASIYRIVFPVVVFSAVIAAATFGFNEVFVPAASKQTIRLRDEILKSKQISTNQPTSYPYIEKTKLKAWVNARSFNVTDRTIEGVTVIAYDKDEKETAVMFAKRMRFDPSDRDNWKIVGEAHIISVGDSRTDIRLENGLWPETVPKLGMSFTELTAERDDQFDTMSMSELRAYADRHRELGDRSKETLANYEYGYWNKITVPLAALVFGSLGAVLGIRNHRTGTAAGFALAVAIIFGYMTVSNFMATWASKGIFPSWVASFCPLIIGLVASGAIMWRRNVL